MLKVKSLGFEGKGSVKYGWLPSGHYTFKGGMSLPTRRFKGGSSRMEGCFLWACHKDSVVYLLKSLIWN